MEIHEISSDCFAISSSKIVEIVVGFQYMRSTIAPCPPFFPNSDLSGSVEGREEGHLKIVISPLPPPRNIMSSSSSWPSGCPEKYPWIGGEERLPRGTSRRGNCMFRKAQGKPPQVTRTCPHFRRYLRKFHLLQRTHVYSSSRTSPWS